MAMVEPDWAVTEEAMGMYSGNSKQPDWRVMALSLVPQVLMAQTPDVSATQSGKFADPALSATAMPSAMSGVMQSMFGLLVVLVLLFGLAWLMRRYKWARASTAGLQVVQGISLGQKERAVVVRVQGRQLLLGVAPGQVTLLTELDPADAETQDGNPVQVNQDATDAASFKAIFKRSLGIGPTHRSSAAVPATQSGNTP